MGLVKDMDIKAVSSRDEVRGNQVDDGWDAIIELD